MSLHDTVIAFETGAKQLEEHLLEKLKAEEQVLAAGARKMYGKFLEELRKLAQLVHPIPVPTIGAEPVAEIVPEAPPSTDSSTTSEIVPSVTSTSPIEPVQPDASTHVEPADVAQMPVVPA